VGIAIAMITKKTLTTKDTKQHKGDRRNRAESPTSRKPKTSPLMNTDDIDQKKGNDQDIRTSEKKKTFNHKGHEGTQRRSPESRGISDIGNLPKFELLES
jgi:hypothetical protein